MDILSTFAPLQKQGNPKNVAPLKQHSKVIVTGAGVFGGWTALKLLRSGFEVVLIDMWGPGNSRSSSGGESRVIRSFYGSNKNYFEMAVKSWDHWKSLEKTSGRKLLHHTGVLWFINHLYGEVAGQMTSIMEQFGQPYELIDSKTAAELYPPINFSDIMGVVIEKNAGYLEAKKATIAITEQFVKEGGKFLLGKCRPGPDSGGNMDSVQVNGQKISADAFIFACGPWLKDVFPLQLKNHLMVTKQEVYYYGIPPEESEVYQSLIPWVDWVPGEFYYGIPGKDNRGFKIAHDERGPQINPTTVERIPDLQLVQRSREYLAKRFPALKNAPLVESRVCQYSNSADGNFIFDSLPGYKNTWILGGGSGHGFKHGPAVGEMVTGTLSGLQQIPADYLIF